MRLTKKYKEDYFINPYNRELTKLDIENDNNSSQIIRNKLGQLEDIEDKLGIDLVTLFLAISNGIWVKEQNTKEQDVVFEIVELNYYDKTLRFKHPRKEIGIGRNIIQYKYAWALAKEELE